MTHPVGRPVHSSILLGRNAAPVGGGSPGKLGVYDMSPPTRRQEIMHKLVKKLTELRPISLVHAIAKIFTKFLAQRLQPKMNKPVAPCQSAFMKNRSIMDNFGFVRGQIKSLKLAKIPSVLLKVDVAKAFDSLSWEFLLRLLRQRGFNNSGPGGLRDCKRRRPLMY